MPADGLCADLTCDKNIKHLYECHCCSSLICFQHLNEHIEATQGNNEQFESLRNELKTVVDTFKVIVEEKLLNIEREKSLIEKAQKLLDAKTGSIDEVQIIFEEIKEAIALSQLDGIIKVEPALQNTKSCSCICKCGNQNDEFLLKITSPPSKSLVHQNLTDETNTSMMTTDDEYSMCDTSVTLDCILLDRTTVSIEDVHIVKEQNKVKSGLLKGLRGFCPLTFDGAFGLTAANHSVRFCSNKKNRPIGLYEHFITKHRLQPIYIRRLLKAISINEDPRTTKLFDESEEVVNQLFKIPCPFSKDMIHSFRGSAKDIRRIPCHYLRMPDYALLHHLQYYHHVTEGVAQTLVNQSKEIQMEKLN
ncbi:unnamed protein product [Adineta steineri]|uniref:Uncharacterized protein n=1 Tax=Adineta steineri TaxID=433720 RepID=A0A814LFK3_9BILA|nr:unnamed protein product [Adineta steineri]CAF1381880.1 unnamed protein product [Adineta steineri]